MRTRSRWRLLHGVVPTAHSHFVLRWPSGRWPGYREQADIARVGRTLAAPDAFLVEWLAPAVLAPHHLAEAHTDARDELQSYLVARDEDDPWRYAREHCSSAANLHSCVRWLHVDPHDPPLVAANASPPVHSIPVTCPRCATPTRLAPSRHFECPSCAWHD